MSYARDEAESIAVGDLVMLITGEGPLMAVTSAYDDSDGFGYCGVAYAVDGVITTDVFPANCLDVVEWETEEEELEDEDE